MKTAKAPAAQFVWAKRHALLTGKLPVSMERNSFYFITGSGMAISGALNINANSDRNAIELAFCKHFGYAVNRVQFFWPTFG